MATRAADVFSLRIPPRPLALPVISDSLGAGFWLADKLAELPYTQSMTAGCETGVTLTLVSPQSIRRGGANTDFCHVFSDRLLLKGLSASEAAEVESLGWGMNDGDWTMLHMPRNQQEADVCWQVLHLAYQNQVSAVIRQPRVQRADHESLPQFSRSHLR